MEKIILGTTERHFKSNAIIRSGQHGVIKGKSCLTDFISFYDKVTCLMDEGNIAGVVFLDLHKAFATVPHSILLNTLKTKMGRFMVCLLKN